MVQMYHIFSKEVIIIMKKNTKRMLMMGALMSAGGAAFMMYKKKNPDCMEDIKDMAKDAASSMLLKLENME